LNDMVIQKSQWMGINIRETSHKQGKR
jgi:hypothetical protein